MGMSTYRYVLTRKCSDNVGRCNFIMLNPSTADEINDDPTIRRCVGYTKKWGYSKLVVTNLYAIRATDPSILRYMFDPIGPENNEYIKKYALLSNKIICAWGNYGVERGKEVMRILHGLPLYALGVTNKGQPVHPLYQRLDTKPILYG